jgi:arsenate reductase (thioredoxin)
MRQRVVFLCTRNSARSQMAEGLLRHLAGDRFDVASAGIEKAEVHPLAVRVMAEVGIDISWHNSKGFEAVVGESWDYAITVCDAARERCPRFPERTRRVHWSVKDPASVSGDDKEQWIAFRTARDELTEWMRHWLESEHRVSDQPSVQPLWRVVLTVGAMVAAALIGWTLGPVVAVVTAATVWLLFWLLRTLWK